MAVIENRVGVACSRESDAVPYGNSAATAGLIRRALIEGGLGERDARVPFADIIGPDTTVLVKPNWVTHANRANWGLDCLVTHPSFTLAALSEVFRAEPRRVIVGDAPIQSCDFDALVTPAWRERVYRMATCPIEILDFRRTILRGEDFVSGQREGIRGEEHYVLFDLGQDSLLDPVSVPDGRFRITNYSPDVLTARHRSGKHEYLLCREPFQADVIINLPKLKTHKKAGVTAALKNLVGLNGNKEYLPHHRVGGAAVGGDCYPGRSVLKRAAEFCLDEGNRRIGRREYLKWRNRASLLLKIQRRLGNSEMEGGWYGNDTVWRMTLDLNRLLVYGRADGTMSDVPLRRIFSLTDGIIAGEGEGPLAPSPVFMGAVTFAASSPFADLMHSALMRFDPERIPLIRESFGDFRYPLVSMSADECHVACDGRIMSVNDVSASLGMAIKPPAGWIGHVEMGKAP